jgi:class 3 adenylate cyclase
MESDREIQANYDVLSLDAVDTSAVSDFDSESELGLAWSESCSALARYLTKKGASIDSSIKWGSATYPSSSNSVTEKPSNKRSGCEVDTLGDTMCPLRKRQRRATVGNLAADMQMLKAMMDGWTSGAQDRQSQEAYLTIGGSVDSVHSMLSLASHASQPSSQIELQEANRWHAADLEPPAAYADSIHRVPSAAESCSDMSSMHSTASDLRSLRSSSCASRSRSMRLSNHTVPQVTVLSIDIKGFTAACAAMPAGRVGEWVAEFYERVDAVAAQHGVSKAEVRGDCCICVSGAAGAVPSRAFAPAAADPHGSQATRMLAFAAALHADLATLSAGGAATATRMGIATGEASFLVSDPAAAAAAAAAPFVSAQGGAAGLAARMEALAAPGAVHVHRSAALRWAAEARCPPPPTAPVDCGGGGLQRAAVFDCAAGAFRRAEGPAPAPAAGGRAGGLRRSASALL